jgi:hypothetical protein
VPGGRHSRAHDDLIQMLYAKRGSITMLSMPHCVGGRREKPVGLPEPTTSSMLVPLCCLLKIFANVEGNCFGEQLIDSLLAEPQDEVDSQGEPATSVLVITLWQLWASAASWGPR